MIVFDSLDLSGGDPSIVEDESVIRAYTNYDQENQHIQH
jgi:hypothetical protein